MVQLRRLVLVSVLAVSLSLSYVGAYSSTGLDLAEEDYKHQRSWLVKADCRTVHPACKTCKLIKVETANSTDAGPKNGNGGKKFKTTLICSTCDAGWTLRRIDPMFCDCAAGLADVGNGTCGSCPKGKFCTGPTKTGGSAAPESCPDGLTVYVPGARSQMQCMTTPGYGRVQIKDPTTGKVTIESVICPSGTYNSGQNSAGCQNCPPAMTTKGQGSGKKEDCGAPPGYYVSNGVAKKCPKGLFSPEFNNQTTCTKCGDGLTTPSEGSASGAECKFAGRGKYIDANTGAAMPCPLNTYSDVESADTSCKPCPDDLRTELEGSEGLAVCLAPPGMELKPGAKILTECPRGYYKEGWNKNPCAPCGLNVDTPRNGSMDVTECFIPVGYGAKVSRDRDWKETVSAEMCTQNTFGYSRPMNNINTAFCNICPPNMYTLDYLTGTVATAGYTSNEDCLVLPGWGIDKTQIAAPCKLGTWSAGLHRHECTPCPAQFTTLWEKANSSADCVIVPGCCRMNADRTGLPTPCNKGSFSTGGSVENPNGTCVLCADGYTTPDDESTKPEDCMVCAEGYGGVNCTLCDYTTFSSGGTPLDCIPCASGTTSIRGAKGSSQCLTVWPLAISASQLYIPLASEAGWTDLGGDQATELACQQACDATPGCILFRFKETAPRACDGLIAANASAASRAAVGFKAFSGGAVQDYAFYYVPGSVSFGIALQDLGSGKTLKQCSDACNSLDNCQAVRATGEGPNLYSCALFGANTDADYASGYKVAAENLLGDGFVVTTV